MSAVYTPAMPTAAALRPQTREEVAAALRAHEAAQREATLDDLLIRWHAWAHPVNVSRGYGGSAPGCGGYRTSRQYDDVNGALDDALEHQQMRQVDHEINELLDPWRAAVICNARNLAVGVAVWSSPRLPQDPEERQEVVRRAREMLARRLAVAGVMRGGRGSAAMATIKATAIRI